MTSQPTLLPTSARAVTLDVRGLPHPQGSMRAHSTPNGKVALRYPPAVIRWRAIVQQAAMDANIEPFTGPVELRLGFDLPRITSHYLPVNSKRSQPMLRSDAPTWPIVAPDIDKLIRAVCDSLTDAGVWRDDAQVAVITAAKRYAEGPPGVHITIIELLTTDNTQP